MRLTLLGLETLPEGVPVEGPDARTAAVQSEKNLLIHGDNLDALRHLAQSNLLTRKPKLAYLDPPFNTGEKWRYYRDYKPSDAWGDDLRARLLAIREILSPEGSLWLHLDDREQHRARVILDEVFGEENFVATVIWQRRTSRENRKAFSSMHDYIHVYAPAGPKRWKLVRNGLLDNGGFTNRDNDPRGPWRSVPMSVQAGHGTASQFYEVVTPSGATLGPPPGRCWAYSQGRFGELVREGKVYWPKNGAGRPRLKRYETEANGLAPTTIWTADEVGDNTAAKKDLMAANLCADVFDTPKPERLLERIIHIATDPGDLVLDPYLGSGTTATVASRMDRRWVGIEQSREVIDSFVLPRLKLADLAKSGDPGAGTARVQVIEAFAGVDSLDIAG